MFAQSTLSSFDMPARYRDILPVLSHAAPHSLHRLRVEGNEASSRPLAYKVLLSLSR